MTSKSGRKTRRHTLYSAIGYNANKTKKEQKKLLIFEPKKLPSSHHLHNESSKLFWLPINHLCSVNWRVNTPSEPIFFPISTLFSNCSIINMPQGPQMGLAQITSWRIATTHHFYEILRQQYLCFHLPQARRDVNLAVCYMTTLIFLLEHLRSICRTTASF